MGSSIDALFISGIHLLGCIQISDVGLSQINILAQFTQDFQYSFMMATLMKEFINNRSDVLILRLKW